MKKIIYINEKGIVSIVNPTEEALTIFTIEELARRDVPAGVAYKIVEETDIPSDRTFRNAWEANITEPDGYGIGADSWFAEKEALNDNN